MQHLSPRVPILAFGRSVLGFDYYPWQAECLAAMAAGFNTAIATANASGKSSLLIPSFVLWFLYNWPRSRCPITSGSWTQLLAQAFGGLRAFQGHPAFQRWQFLESEVRTPEGGYALGISTDTPLRLEGWHRQPGSPLA